MREYGFSLTRISPYKDKILEKIRKISVSENPYSRIFHAVLRKNWINPFTIEITAGK